MRRRGAAAALTLAWAAPAVAQAVLFAEATPEQDAAVAEAFSSMTLDAELAGAPLVIGAALVDLDGDGAAEMLAMLRSTALCRPDAGCPVGVFSREGAGWRLRATVDAEILALGAPGPGGWRDLLLVDARGERRARWTGDGYAPD